MKKLLSFLLCMPLVIFSFVDSNAATIGFADEVLQFWDSGAGPIDGPYGGTYPDNPEFPISVSLDVVLGDEPGPTGFQDFLSLPTGSFVTVGFTDETVFNGPGNDIFINEIGGNGEEANIFVSSDGSDFTFLGTAVDNGITAFDLEDIEFFANVFAIKIIGLDNEGSSPGFDLVNIQISPTSMGPPVPIPGAVWLLGSGLLCLAGLRRKLKIKK